MKLNERVVASYALGPRPPDREGFLWKKGELHTSYQRRWFVLRGNLLFYFERPGEREPQGLIILEGCSVQLCESSAEGFAFAVVFDRAPGMRLYKLAAEDQAAQEAWVKALSSAGLGYIRMLVQDLEKQFEDVYRTGMGPRPQRNTMLDLSPSPPSPAPHQRNVKCQSLITLPSSSGKCARRSPKLWPKRQAHPATPLPPWAGEAQAPPPGSVAPGDAGSGGGGVPVPAPAPEDFLTLHRRYGAAVESARRDWQLSRAGGLRAEPRLGHLVDLS